MKEKLLNMKIGTTGNGLSLLKSLDGNGRGLKVYLRLTILVFLLFLFGSLLENRRVIPPQTFLHEVWSTTLPQQKTIEFKIKNKQTFPTKKLHLT